MGPPRCAAPSLPALATPAQARAWAWPAAGTIKACCPSTRSVPLDSSPPPLPAPASSAPPAGPPPLVFASLLRQASIGPPPPPPPRARRRRTFQKPPHFVQEHVSPLPYRLAARPSTCRTCMVPVGTIASLPRGSSARRHRRRRWRRFDGRHGAHRTCSRRNASAESAHWCCVSTVSPAPLSPLALPPPGPPPGSSSSSPPPFRVPPLPTSPTTRVPGRCLSGAVMMTPPSGTSRLPAEPAEARTVNTEGLYGLLN